MLVAQVLVQMMRWVKNKIKKNMDKDKIPLKILDKIVKVQIFLKI
jgi:hypothetical protein